MPTAPKARCYKCNRHGHLTSGLCQPCRNIYYGREYRQLKAAVLLPHIARFGHWCPGYKHASHKVPLRELTVDHRIPISRGGTTALRNLHVLCASCNKRKAGRGAMPRGAAQKQL